MCGGPRTVQGTAPKQSHMKNIAILGTGIDALLAAWNLNQTNKYSVSIFPVDESSSDFSKYDNFDVSLYDSDSHPSVCSLLKDLEIEPIKTFQKKKFLNHAFHIQKDNDLSAVSWSSVSDTKATFQASHAFGQEIMRFHKDLVSILAYTEDDPRRNVKIGEYVQTGRFSNEFVSGYLVPLLGGDHHSLLQTSVCQVLVLLWKTGLLRGAGLNKEDPTGEVRSL